MKSVRRLTRNLRSLIHERACTDADVAFGCGRSKPWMSRLINGCHKKIAFADLDRLAIFFGVDVMQLLLPERRPSKKTFPSASRHASAVIAESQFGIGTDETGPLPPRSRRRAAAVSISSNPPATDTQPIQIEAAASPAALGVQRVSKPAPTPHPRPAVMDTRGRQELRAWRGRMELTQTALARRLNISIAYLNQIEHGKRQPSARLMKIIMELTGIPMSAW